MPGKEHPQMFAQRAFREPGNFTNVEQALRATAALLLISARASSKHVAHFFGEPLPVFRRIEPQQLLIEGWHRSVLVGSDTQGGQSREMFHPIHLTLQVAASDRSQSVGLPAARSFLFVESLDPIVVE